MPWDFLRFDLGLDLDFDFRLEPPVRDRLVPVCELPIRVTQRVSLRRHQREGLRRQLISFSLLVCCSRLFPRLVHSHVGCGSTPASE